MSNLKHPWVQLALDVEDLGTAVELALMAKDCGADWIEIGTKLLLSCGHKATSVIRAAVGKDIPLVCDYKLPNLRLVIDRAQENSCNYILMENAVDDYTVKDAVRYAEKTGIEPLIIMDVPLADMPKRAARLQELGVKYVFLQHHLEEIWDGSTGLRSYSGVEEICRTVDISVGVSSDQHDEQLEAIRRGASWICFGQLLLKKDPELLKRWIDDIHNTERG
ncbi:MAG: hypothetical protein K6A39_09980 [Clostridiales bacterium]|nr:hypothetical protein [Clostridiales bacterium]